ncbi:MAG: winged helix-turn-helix transcriptional regulator [Actinoallomurus sp.]
MRSYRQYCSVAKALDVLGERWTLLIVRELLAQGACRYTDLRAGLPGIATNLLADRLRELEAAGVVEREDAPPPVATTLYRLTERGAALESVINALGSWGTPLMREQAPGDSFRGQWLTLPVSMFLTDRTPDEPPATVEIRTAGETAVIEAAAGTVTVKTGATTTADAVVTTPPQLLLTVLSGRLGIEAAIRRGLTLHGSRAALERVLPETPVAI